MEYVPSRSLQEALDAEGRLPPTVVARIGIDVLDALTAAHRAGVLHRDVKPSNVLLGPDDRVVLTDIGTATVAGETAVTQSGPMFLSPAYVAPERARHGTDGPAADLWSLGATLYAAVEGAPPYGRGSSIQTLAALISDPVPAAPHAGPLGPALEGLLRKDPATRIGADEAQRPLSAAVPVAPQVERVVAPAARPAETATSRRMRVAAAAALAVLLLAVFGWYATGHPGLGTATPPRTAGPVPHTTAPSATPSTTATSPTPSPGPAGPTVPPGWRIYHDPAGFSVAVPDGWRMTRDGTIVYFREPGGQGRVLGFDHSEHPKPDPLADWRQQEAARVAAGDWTDYHRISLVRVAYFRSAADWDYTYLDHGRQERVRNRNFITSPTHAYAIYWSTPAAAWSANFWMFQTVAASFRPAP
jgi:hypothetical protein